MTLRDIYDMGIGPTESYKQNDLISPVSNAETADNSRYPYLYT